MRHRVTIIALCPLLLFSGIVHAGETSGGKSPMVVEFRREAANFEDPFYTAYITVGESKFTFLVPQGFRIKGDTTTGVLRLCNREGNTAITFAILGQAEGELSADSYRQSLLKQHPGGKIVQELSAGVIGRSGPGFDIQWKAAEDIYQCQRAVFVPTTFGVFQFTTTTGRNAFPDSQRDLGLVMATFRASTDGKFKPVHIAGED
jgi:hypothetical protein